MLNLLIKDIHGGDTIYCIKDIECYKKENLYSRYWRIYKSIL